MDLQIQYFDPTKMSRTSTVLLIGRRGSGKSTLAADIMSHNCRISEGMCVSPTDSMTGFWKQYIPPLFIHHEYDQEITREFLEHQHSKWKRYKSNCKKEGVQPEEGKVDPAFVIYDDVTYDKTFFKNKLTRQLFMNGRHYSTFVLVTCQYLMDIGPDLRGQIDYVFILKEPSRNNREKLYEYFAGMFPSYFAFEEALRCCTDQRECMVIDNTKQSYDVNECVFFYRATGGLKFRMGSEDFWRFGTENYESTDGEESGDENEESAIAKKYFNSGRSKKEIERSAQFKVRKMYPKDDFKPRVASDYAVAYRSTTTTPLIADIAPGPKEGKKEKKKKIKKIKKDEETKKKKP